MGQEITSSHFAKADFDEFQARLEAETRLLERWFREDYFSRQGNIGGFELECCILDKAAQPAPINQSLLERLQNPLVVPELATFNLEINSTARPLQGDVFSRMAQELSEVWRLCDRTAAQFEARMGMFGILPTLCQGHLSLANMSPLNRYRALNEQVFRLRRGRPVELDIDGRSHLRLSHDDVMLESAATSFQIHLQTDPRQAALLYNLSKIVSAPMVAACANSPYLFGRDLWEETRIPLFEQSISVGASDLTKRVSFGIRYAHESIFESFEANLRRYPILLPRLMDEPLEALAHLRLHNGTIWRWNRPLIGFDKTGRPHLRIEHRVVPAGPSVVDGIANAALYFGLVTALAADDRPAEGRLPFAQARDNFYAAARDGLDARLVWFGGRTIGASELLRESLLPLAEQGLALLGVERNEISHWLGIIEARLSKGMTGARWQRAWVARHGCDMQGLAQAALEHLASGRPVHEWPV
jgi:hypothetical protein